MLVFAAGLLAALGCSRHEPGGRETFSQEEAPPASAADIAQAEGEATVLTAEFDRDTDEARRIEIIHALASNGSAPARRMLESIYRQTDALRLRCEVVSALSLMEDEFTFRIPLLSDAANARQPLELREAVLDTLRDILDSRTLPVWQILAADPVSEIREGAAGEIEFWRSLQPER